jgi:hypothetical protein
VHGSPSGPASCVRWAELGLNKFAPALPDLILGRDPSPATTYPKMPGSSPIPDSPPFLMDEGCQHGRGAAPCGGQYAPLRGARSGSTRLRSLPVLSRTKSRPARAPGAVVHDNGPARWFARIKYGSHQRFHAELMYDNVLYHIVDLLITGLVEIPHFCEPAGHVPAFLF